MILTNNVRYFPFPYVFESELESAIVDVKKDLFGAGRIYLEVKQKIGAVGKTNNIPDGYLIDLTSPKNPQLFVVENELAVHDPLRHVAVQLLEFSLSFDSDKHKVKSIVKAALLKDCQAAGACKAYAEANGYENIDVLLETLIYRGGFGALVVIDDLSEELEVILVKKFRFPVEVLTLTRHQSESGEIAYAFDPFLSDVAKSPAVSKDVPTAASVDVSDVDTIVVPARDDGFSDVVLGENRWFKIRIHGSMIPRIKYIAFYRVAPISAITHYAPVASIDQWLDSGKYVVNFAEPAKEIGPIKLQSSGNVKALQNSRYTSLAKLERAGSLEDAF
jgi:hypothetical protein